MIESREDKWFKWKKHISCNRTNAEGTACEKCINLSKIFLRENLSGKHKFSSNSFPLGKLVFNSLERLIKLNFGFFFFLKTLKKYWYRWVNGYELNEEGYCVDIDICEEKEEGKCLKCKDLISPNGYNYCANQIFGCLEIYSDNCLRCDNLNDLYECSECKEGFKIGVFGCESIYSNNIGN